MSQRREQIYIGQYLDDATNLDYLNARYYDGGRGQFTSQDPVFLSIGSPTQLKQLTQLDLSDFLKDPQRQNSYNYGGGNPITNKDPSGLCFEPASFVVRAFTAAAVGTLIGDGIDIYQTNYGKYNAVFSPEEKKRAFVKTGYEAAYDSVGQRTGNNGSEDRSVGT